MMLPSLVSSAGYFPRFETLADEYEFNLLEAPKGRAKRTWWLPWNMHLGFWRKKRAVHSLIHGGRTSMWMFLHKAIFGKRSLDWLLVEIRSAMIPLCVYTARGTT